MFLDKNDNWYFGISKELGENLAEMATVIADTRNNVKIVVNPDINRNLQEEGHFKFYNHQDQGKATKIARIMFKKSEYVYHNDYDGKKIWELNSKEKKLLLNLLNSIYDEEDGITVWQHAIIQFNYEVFGIKHKTSIRRENTNGYSIDIPIPDYNRLVFDKTKGNKFK